MLTFLHPRFVLLALLLIAPLLTLAQAAPTLRVPKAQIAFLANGQPTGTSAIVPRRSKFTLRVVPDAQFAAGNPREARYQIPKVVIMAQLTTGAPSKIAEFDTQRINAARKRGIRFTLPERVLEFEPGTTIYIQLPQIYRLDAEGERHKPPLHRDGPRLWIKLK